MDGNGGMGILLIVIVPRRWDSWKMMENDGK